MTSCVEELQNHCLDPNYPLAELLNKAYFIALKLDLVELSTWLKNEIYGYREQAPIPVYREVQSELYIENSYHQRKIPLSIPDQEFENKVKRVFLIQPISELEPFKKMDPSAGELELPIPGNKRVILQRMFGTSSLIKQVVSLTDVVGICETVRHKILEWAVQLEKEGIRGENLTFNKEEKEKAVNNYQITNCQNIFGNVYGDNLNQNFSISPGNTSELQTFLKKNGLEQTQISQLLAAIKADPKPTQSNKIGQNVANWLGKIVWEGITNITTDLIVKAIQHYYGNF